MGRGRQRTRRVTVLALVFLSQDVIRQGLVALCVLVQKEFVDGVRLGVREWGTLLLHSLKDVTTLSPLTTVMLMCHLLIGAGLLQRGGWARHAALHYSWIVGSGLFLMGWVVGWWPTAPYLVPHLLIYTTTLIMLTRPVVQAEFQSQGS